MTETLVEKASSLLANGVHTASSVVSNGVHTASSVVSNGAHTVSSVVSNGVHTEYMCVCPDSPASIQRQKVLEQKKTETKKWFEEYFTGITKKIPGQEHLEITRKDFLKVLQDVEMFSKHFFRLFDSDDSGDVSIEEIQAGLNKLSDAGEADKMTIKWFKKRFQKFTPSNVEVNEEIFLKAINKEFVQRLFSLMDIDGGGTLNLEEFKRSVDRLLMMGSDEKILLYLEKKFHEVAQDPENITYEDFKKVIYNKQEYFTKKMFEICDRDNSQTISLPEFTETLGKLMKKSDDVTEQEKINKDKLYFLFRIYDDDNSGEISRQEMRDCIKICTQESNLELDEVEKIADTLFQKADEDGNGSISFTEFYNTLHPFIENLEINPKGWVLPQREKTLKERITEGRDKYFSRKFLKNNIVLILNTMVLIILYIIVFTIGIVYYRDTFPALMIAKGSGKCLNLTSVLLFLSMCRWSLTSLRNTPAGKGLALDSIVDIHKILGVVFAFFAVVHTGAHILTFVRNREVNSEGMDSVDWTFVLTYGGHWGGAYISGVCLLITLAILLIFAHTSVRRGGHFTLFYWVHFFTYTLLALGSIVHCVNFWKWICLPLTIYLLEKISNMHFIKKAMYGRFFIADYKILPSNVIELTLNRTATFNFNSGSYVFLQIPFITPYEKHPFTISSSAENKSNLTFHIKKQQGWTKKLYDELVKDDMERRMIKEQELLALGDIDEVGHVNGEIHVTMKPSEVQKYPWLKNFGLLKRKQLEVFIDGPYGAPATDIFDSEHAVLIAAGIGVTPFASILQTIVDKYEQSGCICSQCGHWTDHGTFNTKITKVDFVWITRDQKSLQWFLDLLRQLELAMDKFSSRDPHKSKKLRGAKAKDRYSYPNGRGTRDRVLTETSIEETEKNLPTCDPSKFLNFHIYLTSALSKKDFRAVGLQYALQLMREGDNNRDYITGLKAETNTGRPDWNELFDKIESDRHGKITVFFCGSPVIEEQLQMECDKRRLKFKAEKF